MNTNDRHQIWEIYVKGTSVLRLASDIVKAAEQTYSMGEAQLKRKIAEGTVAADAYLKCSECGNPVYFVAANATQCAHLKHKAVTDESARLRLHHCRFYTQADLTMMDEVYKGEPSEQLHLVKHQDYRRLAFENSPALVLIAQHFV